MLAQSTKGKSEIKFWVGLNHPELELNDKQFHNLFALCVLLCLASLCITVMDRLFCCFFVNVFGKDAVGL